MLEFEVTVSDMDPMNPKASSDRVMVNIRNINDPPACTLAQPSLASLWPPNHKMRQVLINGVSDNDSTYKNVALVITGVTQDESVVSHGSGHTSPDAVIQDMDPNDAVLLRAEREGHGNGRVYQINFTASDGFESCTGSVQVFVPRSRKPEKHLECDDDEHEDRKHRSGDKRHKDKDHKRHKHCKVKKSAPSVLDDGQNHDATVQVKHRHHSVREKIREKLERLKKKMKKKMKKHDNDHAESKEHKNKKSAEHHERNKRRGK